MQLFKCQSCQQVVYFENTDCERCGHKLGYIPTLGVVSAVEPEGPNWIALANPALRYRFCVNWEQHACNWMVESTTDETFCLACRHNRTIPDLTAADNLARWRKIEHAKRRLFYSLLKLKLPTPAPDSGDPRPLVFDFLAATPENPGVKTGHYNGVITISLDEADDAKRELVRSSMGELYRTLLGHFRHEVGHYYWDTLVADRGELDTFRALFGDERKDYAAAINTHYQQGPPAGWQDNFVSAYATMHPWEDWAETWAHYLHIVDTLEMAAAFGIRISPDIADDPTLETEVTFDPHRPVSIKRLIDTWLPLTYAVNCLNRSMGQPDIYPFVIPPRVIEKMACIHRLIHRKR
jgi:hypothetical protein